MKKLTIVLFSFMLNYVVFAQGFYMEMQMSSADNAKFGSVKVYAQDGNSRSEISITTPVGPMNLTNLILKDNPNLLYMLSEKNHTYSVTDISQNNQYKDFAQQEYEITVIGKEKVNGYNTTHVKIARKGADDVEEMWTSKEVADYTALMSAKTKFTGRENLNKALAAKGADGFPVRIKTTEKGMEIQIALIKAEKKDQPASLFSLNGYTKSGGASSGGQSQSGQDMLQKLQNMTPEERQQYIDQLKSQYGQQPK